MKCQTICKWGQKFQITQVPSFITELTIYPSVNVAVREAVDKAGLKNVNRRDVLEAVRKGLEKEGVDVEESTMKGLG